MVIGRIFRPEITEIFFDPVRTRPGPKNAHLLCTAARSGSEPPARALHGQQEGSRIREGLRDRQSLRPLSASRGSAWEVTAQVARLGHSLSLSLRTCDLCESQPKRIRPESPFLARGSIFPPGQVHSIHTHVARSSLFVLV
jgi:hypothetical protein